MIKAESTIGIVTFIILKFEAGCGGGCCDFISWKVKAGRSGVKV